ncbi:MAG: M1 family metallopeptidase [Chloroflexi bacterium]|nr:M1 family metallopeptidase [Chloroflexota bacterium]
MPARLKPWWVAALVLVLSACAAPPATVALPTPVAYTVTPLGDGLRGGTATPWEPAPLTATLAPSPSPTRPLTPTATRIPPDRAVSTRHRLQATYDQAAQWLGVEHTLTYTNPTAETLTELPLVVPPWYYFALTWDRLRVDGQPVAVDDLPAKPGHLLLSIPLPQPLPPGGTVTLDMAYHIWLPRLRVTGGETNRPMVFGYSERQTNLVDWYPFVPAYLEGEGWLVRRAWPYGEFLTRPRADYEVIWRGPETWTPASNLDPSPCPPEAAPEARCFTLTAARDAVLSVSPYYVRLSREVVQPDGGAVTLEAFVFAGHRGPGEVALEHAAQALQDYAAAFGPYHRPRLTLIEGDFPFSMEYDGLFFVRASHFDLTPEKFLTAITVHEVAHQWWYAQVANDQALHPWLDEALATHCEAWYYRRRLPAWADWWETGRWEGLEPAGFIDGSIYEYGGFFAYRRAVYHNGERFWAAVHAHLGDEDWAALLHAYRDANFGGIARPEDLAARIAAAWPTAPWDDYFAARPVP